MAYSTTVRLFPIVITGRLFDIGYVAGSVVVEVNFKSTGSAMTQEEALLPIGEVARQSGIASSALRYYERCELINAGVKIGGRRHYPLSVLHRLSVIKVCQHIGFSLAEIADLLNGSLARNGAWRHLAMSKRRDLQVRIGQLESLLELLELTLGCECRALDDCPQMAPGGYLADCGGVRTPNACEALEGWQQGA